MSDNIMETAPGGQSTQYESIKQFTNPPAKEVGQLGDPSAATKPATTDDATTNKMATSSTHQHQHQQHGSPDEDAEQRARREQGYGGERDMARDVGA